MKIITIEVGEETYKRLTALATLGKPGIGDTPEQVAEAMIAICAAESITIYRDELANQKK